MTSYKGFSLCHCFYVNRRIYEAVLEEKKMLKAYLYKAIDISFANQI